MLRKQFTLITLTFLTLFSGCAPSYQQLPSNIKVITAETNPEMAEQLRYLDSQQDRRNNYALLGEEVRDFESDTAENCKDVNLSGMSLVDPSGAKGQSEFDIIVSGKSPKCGERRYKVSVKTAEPFDGKYEPKMRRVRILGVVN